MLRLLLLLLLLSLNLSAQGLPEATVARLYPWLRQADTQVSQRLAEVEDCLTPELYRQLRGAYAADPASGNFLDFDPWSNSQMGASDYRWGQAKMVGGLAKVPITVMIYRGGRTQYTCILRPGGSGWQVANLVYGPDFDLLSVLKQVTAPSNPSPRP